MLNATLPFKKAFVSQIHINKQLSILGNSSSKTKHLLASLHISLSHSHHLPSFTVISHVLGSSNQLVPPSQDCTNGVITCGTNVTFFNTVTMLVLWVHYTL